MTMNKIKLLVCDDQTVVREGLVAILANYPDIDVIGQAEDGLMAIKMAKELQPDVILLDMVMPKMDGLDTIQQDHVRL